MFTFEQYLHLEIKIIFVSTEEFKLKNPFIIIFKYKLFSKGLIWILSELILSYQIFRIQLFSDQLISYVFMK